MSEIKTDSKWDNREIGALWLKTAKGSGQKFMTGTIKTSLEGKIDVIVFPSRDKKNDKAPDFRIYISEKTEVRSSIPTPAVEPTRLKTSTPAKTSAKASAKEVLAEVDDIL